MWLSDAGRPRSVGNNPNEKTGPPTFRLKLGLDGEAKNFGKRPTARRGGKGRIKPRITRIRLRRPAFVQRYGEAEGFHLREATT